MPWPHPEPTRLVVPPMTWRSSPQRAPWEVEELRGVDKLPRQPWRWSQRVSPTSMGAPRVHTRVAAVGRAWMPRDEASRARDGVTGEFKKEATARGLIGGRSRASRTGGGGCYSVPQDFNCISAVDLELSRETSGRGGVSLLDLRISASRPRLIRANAYIDVAASFKAWREDDQPSVVVLERQGTRGEGDREAVVGGHRKTFEDETQG